jgi:acetyl esterase/lipase
MMTRSLRTLVLLGIALVSSNSRGAGLPDVIDLWPAIAPGEKENIGEEKDTTKPTDQLVAGKPVIRLGNVSKPTLSLYRPPTDKDTGAAVLVCPGGGYHILAMDLEGTEVCAWLNSIGVTAALLKYRVPKREGLERHTAPLQDAQRALGLLRSRAKEFSLDPQRIGAIGFSAGGHLIAALASNPVQRTYAAVDAADALSCRPDFNIVIYPGYLVLKDEGDKINPSVAVTTNHPPTFLAMAQDDPVRVENAVLYYLALKQAGVPSELHTYPTGGHGYGLRRTEHLVTTWPGRAADWMKGRGLLPRR